MVAIVVIVTAGLLLAATYMAFPHPARFAREPGIAPTVTPRITLPQSFATTTQRSIADGGADSTQHESGGSTADSRTSSNSSTRGHAPQAVELDPFVAVDHDHRQPALAVPAVLAGTAAPTTPGHTEVNDDDGDKKPARNGVKESDDNDRGIDDWADG